ncbi:MAG: C1 family peptidase [Deltaproteobacteria bacterium]|nr:C1 family peptidase [Deltaproteobacteria bacterium]
MRHIRTIAVVLALTLPVSTLAQSGESFTPQQGIQAALAYFARNPARQSQLLPADANLQNMAFERSIDASLGDQGSRTIYLNTPRNILVDFGRSLLWKTDRANILRLYTTLYRKLPKRFRTDLLTPRQVTAKPLPKLRGALLNISKRILSDLRPIMRTMQTAIPGLMAVNPIASCFDEVGRVFDGIGAEDSERCEVSEYSPLGLFLNTSFPLKDNLTCIRDQGSRGTCVAHGIVAAIESIEDVRSNIPENLGEQFVYYFGETRGDASLDLYEMQNYGMATDRALDKFVRLRPGIFYESGWAYNRSLLMEPIARNNATGLFEHARSCEYEYYGAACSDFTWQTAGTPELFAVPNAAPAPAQSGTPVHQIATNSYLAAGSGLTDYSLGNMIVLLSSDIPVIVSMAITDSFSRSSGGYIRIQPNDPVRGGHTMEFIGFIPNGALPAGVGRASREGFFIAKNSWGTSSGDCGFYYIDYAYVREHMYYANMITID